MKLLFRSLSLILPFLLAACATLETPMERNPDQKIEKQSENLTFTPQQIRLEVEPDLFVTVKPVDATLVDSITTIASLRTGAYENSITQRFTEANRSQEDLSPYNRQVLRVTNVIISQIERGEVPENLGVNLINRMWEGEKVGYNGSEIESLAGIAYTNEFNPFYYNNNYLSVFELTLENNAEQIQTLSIDDFQISNENESLRPYGNDFMMSRLVNDERIDNLNRYNMPESQTVAPGQVIKKFIAVPAIRETSNSVIVQVIRDSGSFNEYKFDINRDTSAEELFFTNFKINPERFLGSSSVTNRLYDKFYSIQLENGNSFALKSNSFYVPRQEMNQKVRMCYAAVASNGSAGPRFSCTSLNLEDFEDGIID
jgi:hypothetical protein